LFFRASSRERISFAQAAAQRASSSNPLIQSHRSAFRSVARNTNKKKRSRETETKETSPIIVVNIVLIVVPHSPRTIPVRSCVSPPRGFEKTRFPRTRVFPVARLKRLLQKNRQEEKRILSREARFLSLRVRSTGTTIKSRCSPLFFVLCKVFSRG
jgi:hypothetical protein